MGEKWGGLQILQVIQDRSVREDVDEAGKECSTCTSKERKKQT